MEHAELEALAASLPLGDLEPGELETLERHLAACTPCRELARASRAAWNSLAFSAEPRLPPPEVKQRVLALAAPEPVPQPEAAFPGLGFWRWTAAAALAALLLLPRPGGSGPRVIGLSGPARQGGAPVSLGSRVEPGRTLELGPQARVELLLDGDAVVRLGGEASAVVDGGGGRWTLRLERGWALNAVRPGADFSVRVRGASASALGTVFFVSAAAAEKVYVCICRGRIRVEAAGSSRELAAAHHYAVDIVGPLGSRRMSEGRMEGHDDAGVRSLEALTPW